MLLTTLLSFVVSVVVSLAVIYFSKKHDFFIDSCHSTKPQNFHEDCTPRAGGIGILAGIMLTMFSAFGIQFILSTLLAFVSGIFEDFHNSLSAKLRLILQIIAALIAIGITDSVVTYLGLGITLPYWLGVIFSAFAIVGMMNAINMIDGFNGLASGMVLIILGSFTLVAYQHHNVELLHLLSIVGGSVFGFFVLVFPQGRIFLGDGGAYMLGFIVSILGIYLANTYADVSPWYILSLFVYPVWEVIFSIGRKLSIGHSPMEPDRYHVHMLVYRQLTKSNPLTALLILTSVLPFAIASTLYAKNSIANITISGIFVLLYCISYLFLYRKEINSQRV